MVKIVEQQLLVVVSFAMTILYSSKTPYGVITLLLGVIFSELGFVCMERLDSQKSLYFSGLFGLVCFIAGFFLRPLFFFFAIPTYFVTIKRCYPGILVLVASGTCVYASFEENGLVVWISLVVLAGILAFNSARAEQYKSSYLEVADSSVELEKNLKKKNKEILESQDASIHVATLQERNRIAREIHDNVGHMLSRTILQTGALMTIYKEEPLHEQLVSINDSLNDAMNNIRESVHDLHNDSVDFKHALETITDEMKGRYIIKFDFDMTNSVPANVKYCFIAIAKEAMTNIVKHSDATHVSLLVREHPGFYQMLIEDNGSVSKTVKTDGIGLTNMEDRVRGLSGNIQFLTDEGFKIRISIPKEN